MISQRELGRRFGRGDDPGSIPAASNVTVESAEGSDDEFEAYVVGYNWAMYAGRLPDGSVVVFDGWYGYSRSTSSQLSALKGGIGYDQLRTSELKPQVRSEYKAERDAEHRIERRPNSYPA